MLHRAPGGLRLNHIVGDVGQHTLGYERVLQITLKTGRVNLLHSFDSMIYIILCKISAESIVQKKLMMSVQLSPKSLDCP